MAWHSYGIGEGKTFSKEFLDKLYKDVNDSLPSDLFPQGTMGAKFLVNVGMSIEDFEPKHKHSSRRKHKIKAEKAVKTVQ
jgi:hypothetical protein